MRFLKVNRFVVFISFFICGAIFYLKTENRVIIDKLSERYLAMARRKFSDVLKGSNSLDCDTSIKTVKWGTKKLIDDYHSTSKGNDRIFFHETSGRMDLSFSQTCAIESAALHNSQRLVQVFIQTQQKSYLHSSSTWLRVLDHYPNALSIFIDDEELYFRDSLLEK